MLPSLWGPKLWTLLHGIGGKAGRSIPALRADEIRELKWLVNNLETIIPCNECQTHIKIYRKAKPPPPNPSEYAHWFWEFHEAVNARLGKPSFPFTPDVSINIHQAWKTFNYTIGSREINAEFIKKFGRHLQLWIGFAGI